MATPEDGFNSFWARYPRRIARMDAEKAYGQMRRKGVTHDRIMAGLERFLENLPEQACYIPYPASWLRAGRFDDEYEVSVPVVREYWADECQREHGGTCSRQWDHVYKMRESA